MLKALNNAPYTKGALTIQQLDQLGVGCRVGWLSNLKLVQPLNCVRAVILYFHEKTLLSERITKLVFNNIILNLMQLRDNINITSSTCQLTKEEKRKIKEFINVMMGYLKNGVLLTILSAAKTSQFNIILTDRGI